jgi:uncharacterized membrane protein
MATLESNFDVVSPAKPPKAQPLRKPAERQINVSEAERIGSTLAGLALIATSLRRKTFRGTGLSLLSGAGLLYRGISGHCSVYAALGIDRAQRHSRKLGVRAKHGVKVDDAVVINRPAADLYRYWRDFENLPKILEHVSAVIQFDDKHSRWIAQGPLDQHLEWQAEILNERENELIAWRSLPGSDVDTAGSIRFEELPADHGTAVTLSLKYDPPGGKLASTLGGLLGRHPEQEIRAGLRRFKQLMEASETPSVEGQPQGTCSHCASPPKGSKP